MSILQSSSALPLLSIFAKEGERKSNAPAFGTPSLLKEGEGGVSILKAGVTAVMEGPD